MANVRLDPHQTLLTTAIEDIAGGVEAADVLAYISDPAFGLTPEQALTLFAQAADAVNTAADINPGTDTTAADIDNGVEEVTVIVDVTTPRVDGTIDSKPVTLKVPKSKPKPLWEQIVSDFWKWYRAEYKSGSIKPGTKLPTFEIIGVY